MPETLNYFDDDSLLEAAVSLDGSGNYLSAYIATNDVKRIRVGIYGAGAGAVTIQQSLSSANDYFVASPQTVATSSGAGMADVDLVGRYFRLRVDSGSASATVRISIRAIERT